MSGLTSEFVLNASLCRPAHCSDADMETRREQIDYIQFAPSYAEPGYTQPAAGILFGDWNYFSGDVCRILEKMGYECEWADEWTTCTECGRAVRTQANSWCWQPSFFVMDGELLCRDCVAMEDYIKTLEDNPAKAFSGHADVSEYGYEKIKDGCQNGLHPGQTDDPKTIYSRLKEQGISRILFVIDDVGQFGISFSVWRKITE